jgi:molecular chaperone Hsp33
MPDLPGDGDFSNPDTADQDFVEDDKWTRTKSLLATLADDELADPDLSAERLLFRLYHETGVRVFSPVELEERCTCSAERIEAMLRDNFTPEEREEMVVDGEIEVVCEFCSADYHFQLHEFEETEH